MPKQSAGLLMYRKKQDETEVFLVHPGGPFWRGKDLGAWSIPKGEILPGEDSLAAAKREFEEETGITPEGEFLRLGEVKQAGGKVVIAWAFAGDVAGPILSKTFSMEWPPKSGRMQEFPEVDRGEWFSSQEARKRMLSAQAQFIDRLQLIVTTP